MRPLHLLLAPLITGLNTALVVLLLASGCRPDIDPPGASVAGGGEGGGGAITFVLEPEAPFEEAPLAVRIRVMGGAVDAGGVRFVAGEVGPGHLRQLADGDASAALEERFLAASVWQEGADLVVAPHGLLEPGGRYALAIPDHARLLELTATTATDGVLRRAWPPRDSVAALPRAVLCGDADLPPLRVEARLAPGDVEATVERGASASGAGARCVRVVAPLPVATGLALIPPPSLQAPGVMLSLDPAPLVVGDAAPPPVAPLACDPHEIRFGPGCARILDDRARIRTPEAPLFWVLGAPGGEQIAVSEPGDPLVVIGLAPGSTSDLGVSVTDLGGREELAAVAVQTEPPMAHVIVNELLADSVGPDATGEWIELFNDGRVPADLGQLRILDAGGEIVLPTVQLAPGAFALVASVGWSPDPALDAAPPPGSLVLRVPRLGLHGLSNAGELIRLVDAAGEVLSAVPATRSPGPGTSTARREPWLADAPSSFAPAAPTPGAANQLLP